MTIDAVFVPADELRRLREVSLERELAFYADGSREAWLESYPQVRATIERECREGERDHGIAEELRQYRPAEWDKLLRLVERRAVERMRREGRSAPEIELALALYGDGQVYQLVSGEELDEILEAHPTIASDEGVQAALGAQRDNVF
jgi:hypothetical protein